MCQTIHHPQPEYLHQQVPKLRWKISLQVLLNGVIFE